MDGNYLERSVDAQTFELFKRLGEQLGKDGEKYCIHGREMEIEEPLIFSFYESLMRSQQHAAQGHMLPTLREIVDTIYSGPPIDYVVLSAE